MKKISGKFFASPIPGLRLRPAYGCPKTILSFLSRSPEGVRRRDAPNKTLRLLLLPFLLAAAVAWAQSPVYTIGVDGLSCPFCAYGIEKQLKKLEGVAQVKVDVAKGQVVVSMNEGKTLEQAQAVEAVKKAGFTMRSFEPGQEGAGS